MIVLHLGVGNGGDRIRGVEESFHFKQEQAHGRFAPRPLGTVAGEVESSLGTKREKGIKRANQIGTMPQGKKGKQRRGRLTIWGPSLRLRMGGKGGVQGSEKRRGVAPISGMQKKKKKKNGRAILSANVRHRSQREGGKAKQDQGQGLVRELRKRTSHCWSVSKCAAGPGRKQEKRSSANQSNQSTLHPGRTRKISLAKSRCSCSHVENPPLMAEQMF